MQFLMHFLGSPYEHLKKAVYQVLLTFFKEFDPTTKPDQQCDKSNEYIIRLIIYECSMPLQIFERTELCNQIFYFFGHA